MAEGELPVNSWSVFCFIAHKDKFKRVSTSRPAAWLVASTKPEATAHGTRLGEFLEALKPELTADLRPMPLEDDSAEHRMARIQGRRSF